MRKDVNIEALRICMCFFVIGIHLWGTYRVWEGVFYPSVLFGNCMVSCAVPVFFMITGYLFNANKTVKHYFKRLFLYIIVPTIVVSFFSAVLMPRLLGVMSTMLGKDFSDGSEMVSVLQFVKAILTGNIAELPYCFHLWYITELTKCYLLFPVLILLCREGKYEKQVRWLLLGLGFVFIVVIKTLNMFGINIEMLWESPIGIYAWYLLLGYEIKIFLDGKQNRKCCLWGLGMYLASVIVVFCLSYHLDYARDLVVDKVYFDTGSLFCALQALGIFLFIKNIGIPIKAEGIVISIGNKTFGIYLIHVIVYSVIWHLKIESVINLVGVPAFCLVFAILTFGVSLVGTWVCQFLHGKVMAIWKGKKIC